MRNVVLRVVAAACVAAGCVFLSTGALVGALGCALCAAGVLVRVKRPAVQTDDPDDVVQFGWGTHESVRQVSER